MVGVGAGRADDVDAAAGESVECGERGDFVAFGERWIVNVSEEDWRAVDQMDKPADRLNGARRDRFYSRLFFVLY